MNERHNRTRSQRERKQTALLSISDSSSRVLIIVGLIDIHGYSPPKLLSSHFD